MTYIGPTSTLPPSARTKINITQARDQTMPVTEQVPDTTAIVPWRRERRQRERRRHNQPPLIDLRGGDRRSRRRIDVEV